MRSPSLTVWIFGVLALSGSNLCCGEPSDALVFETAAFRYVMSHTAQNQAFVDRATGTDYLQDNPPSPAAWVRVNGQTVLATSAVRTEDGFALRFGERELGAVLRTETHRARMVFTVESVRGDEIESLTFLNVPLQLKGTPDEPFAACALALNLHTRVDALPALQRELRASCERKFGLIGAKVALVSTPMAGILPELQETLNTSSELPVCKVAGPWAHGIPFNHGSYLFNFGSLTESNLHEWITMTRSLGFTQIDNHGGGAFFRFGDLELNREKWPEGWEHWRRIVARFHTEGIGSIFHTYAFFIDKQSKYVAPVPDSRLDAFRTFTLGKPLGLDATEIIVNESTANLSTVTGFFEHNSVVLHLGDELITFSGFSREPPWKFTGLQRGALGTRAAAHPRGATARHLKECFGLFVPDVESSLFEEIAANHADVLNRCGFDGVYLDAIDGSSILRGADECWYWANKFVVAIQQRLEKPVGMEMSAMWHHFWQYRTRWQAWDYPQRGHQRFLDIHAAEINGGLLLPLHLGWWGFQVFNPPQIEPSYPDVIEQLGAKLIGWDAGVSLTAGVDRKSLATTPLFRRAVDTLRTCEELRHARVFSETAKRKLREPGSAFTLVTNITGNLRFRRLQSQAHTATLGEPWTLTWGVTNTFAGQPLRLRLEALISAEPAASPSALQVIDLTAAGTDSAAFQTTADGVSLRIDKPAKHDDRLTALVATNAGHVARTAAWARWEKRFDPWLDLKAHQALGLEIEGDGSGALLAVRLESPRHLAYGAVADRYVTLDFTGRRLLTLVETESARWSDYFWNDGKHPYNTYRETINFGAVASLSVWLQNLAPGHTTRIALGPIRALPLQAVPVRNPRIRGDGKTLTFPIALTSGSWLEVNGPEDCTAYGPKGERLGKVTPQGDWPTLPSGRTSLMFDCETGSDGQPRARIVVFALGEEL